MRPINCSVAALSLLLVASVPRVAAEKAPSVGEDTTSQGGGVVSPTVMATWIEHGEGAGMVLDVVILWRGTPGWFLRSSATSGGSAPHGGMSTTIKMPGRDLRFVFEPGTRIARVQGDEVALGEANVIFVDGVGTPEGPHVVRMTAVDRDVPDSFSTAIGGRSFAQRGAWFEAVLRRIPDLNSFIRCEFEGSDARLQAFATNCRELTQ